MPATQFQPLNQANAADFCGSDMPAFIEQTARELGAFYCPDHVAVLKNIDADERRVQSYLGTYFPRTVFEFQTIADELINLSQMMGTKTKPRALRVLDLGSGTGGAWIGLALALAQAGKERHLCVDAIDGNAIALGCQQPFASAIADATSINVQLKTHHVALGLTRQEFARDLSAALASFVEKFDIVLVSKHLSEFYHEGYSNATGIIQDALQLLSGVLQQGGHLIVLDMTDRINGNGEYFPKTMAREIGRYLASAPMGLKPILPIPCAHFMSSGCASRGACYTQRVFELRHDVAGTGYSRSAVSKVSYRVFTTPSNAAQICSMYPRDLAYCINAKEVCRGGKVFEAPSSHNGFIPCSI